MKDLNTTTRCRFYCPPIFFSDMMEIKPFYEKSYIVKFKRRKDEQNTELVNTDGNEVISTIVNLFDGKFVNPASRNTNGATKIVVSECDHVNHVVCSVPFVYKIGGTERMLSYSLVGNMSPRQARIALEKHIKNI